MGKITRLWALPGLLPLLVSQHSLAGAETGPLVSWAPLPDKVPTLSTWALIMLAVLIAVLALRTWREAPNVLRSLLLLAVVGVSGSSLLWTGDAKSGVVEFTTTNCTGSLNVQGTGTGLVNNCGATVVLTVGSCAAGRSLTCWNSPNPCAATGDKLVNGGQKALPHCER